MVQNCTILGKKTVGRLETLEYASKRFGWQNCVIGISCFFGFWAWILGRLTGRKVIYYCIDFYSPEISEGFWDSIFIWLAMQMDKFLCKVVDEVWDISERIQKGRWKFGNYTVRDHKIIPLSYPPSYFRFRKDIVENRIVFVGLKPYGLELIPNNVDFEWVGRGQLSLEELLEKLAHSGIGVSLWEKNGNNYYGDPGKTKLYSACGLPVIMTNNTPYAEIIEKTQAGMVVPYKREAVGEAIKKILANYDFYKFNTLKTWQYINADEIFGNIKILE